MQFSFDLLQPSVLIINIRQCLNSIFGGRIGYLTEISILIISILDLMRFDIICRWLSILTDLANDFVMSRELKFLFYSRLNFCIYFFIFFIPLLNVDLLSIIITKLIINRTKSVTLIHPMHKNNTYNVPKINIPGAGISFIYSIFSSFVQPFNSLFSSFPSNITTSFILNGFFSCIYIIFTISSSTNPLNTVISDSSISGVI